MENNFEAKEAMVDLKLIVNHYHKVKYKYSINYNLLLLSLLKINAKLTPFAISKKQKYFSDFYLDSSQRKKKNVNDSEEDIEEQKLMPYEVLDHPSWYRVGEAPKMFTVSGFFFYF